MDNNRTWEALSMKDRASFIKLAIQNGYRDLDSIRSLYNNSNTFRDGGSKSKTSTPVFNSSNMRGFTNKQLSNLNYLNTINDTIPNTRRAALLAAEIHESSLDPRAVGDGGKALGLLQVHPNRRTDLYNKKGTDKEMINNQSTAIVDALSGRDSNRDHWTHGGKGSGFNSWKEAQKTFYNNNSSLEEVNRALNRGFIRPHDAAIKTKERLKTAEQIYNILEGKKFDDGGYKKAFWDYVTEAASDRRDARIGAVGARQVRELYNQGREEEAQELAKKYAKANVAGISLAGGVASTGLLGDIITTTGTTLLDTLIDNSWRDVTKNTVINAGLDVLGHGLGKALNNTIDYVLPTIRGAFKNTTLDWDNWSKSGKKVPKYRQYQYRDIESKLKRLGKDIDKISKDLDVDPRAYIQMNSPQFINSGYYPKVYYRGTHVPNATHFPKPTDPDYIPANGRATATEGIYFTDNYNYAERYTKPKIGIREYDSVPTGDVHKIAVRGNFANLRDIPIDKQRIDLFHKMYTADRQDIEKYGYNFIENMLNKVQGGRRNEWLVFEPTQIKSLEGNIGTFNPNSKYIYKALGGPLYNQDNPIESFQGNPYIPIVRY